MLYFHYMRTDFVERMGKIEELDRSFDLKFWQAQTDADRFAAAWELVVHSYIIKGKDVSQLRLQRTIENFQRLSS
jgi:hypothetical protein